MKVRDVILGLTSAGLYFVYGSATADLLVQVQAVFLAATVGVATALYAIVKGKLE